MSSEFSGGLNCVLQDVLITDELIRRPSRPPDHEAEARALGALAQALATNPRGLLQKVVETAMALCQADSSGISILESGSPEACCQWEAAAGVFAATVNRRMTPRAASPCAEVIARSTVMLFDRAERCFPALQGVAPPMYESLLVPWDVAGRTVGTLWAISHTPDRHFDAEDARLLGSVARFASAAWQTVIALDAATLRGGELEQRVQHRTRELSEANRRLREREERIRRALSISTVGVLYFSLDGRITDANEALERMSGYSRDELRAIAHWEVLTPPEFMDVTARAAEELAATGDTAPYEKQWIRKDGSRWWGLFAPKRLTGSGRGAQCLEVVIDITASKHAEQRLRESERRQAFLLDLSDALRPLHDPVAIQATATRIVGERLEATRALYVEFEEGEKDSTVWRDYHAADLPSLAGRHGLDKFDPTLLAELRAGRTLAVRDVRAQPLLAEPARAAFEAAGTRAYVNVPLVKEGRLVSMLTIQQASPRDWTADEIALVEQVAERTWASVERAHAEAALRAREARYRLLFDSIDEGFAVVEMIFDDRGVPLDFLIVECNPAQEKMTGFRDIAGRRLRELVPEGEQIWIERFGQVALTGVPVRFADRVEFLGRWLDVHASRVGGEGSRTVALVFNDVTGLKRAEAALREGERRRAFLLELTDGLRPLNDPVEIQAVAARLLGHHLGADNVCCCELDDEAHQDFASQLDALRAGHRLVIPDVLASPLLTPEERARHEARGVRAQINFPLLDDGRLAAVLSVCQSSPRDWTPHEAALVGEAAERTWLAVERARAEAALRESEAKYRSLFETMDEGFALCEVVRDAGGRAVDYRFLEVNRAFEEQLGISRGEAKGGLSGALFAGRDEHVLHTYAQVVETGEPVRFERFAASNGRWYDVSAVPRGGDRFAVLFDDISERKRAEQALRASEGRQAFLLKLSDALRGLAEPADIQFEASRVLGEHLGANRVLYTEGERRGRTWVVPRQYCSGVPGVEKPGRYTDYEPTLLEEMRRGRITSRSDVAADPRLTPAQKAAHAAIQVGAWATAPLVKEERLVAALTVHFRTAHEWTAEELALIEEAAERTWAAAVRARAEAALRESEERLRLIVDSVADYAIFTLDRAGRITSWNPGAERVFGYSAEEAIGQPSDIIFTAEDRAADAPQAEIRRVAEVGRAEDERWHVDKAGRRFYVSGVLAPLSTEGGLTGYVKVARDTTRSKELEDALRRAHDQMEHRVRERTSELARANASLRAEVRERRAAEEQNKALFKQLVSVQEEERRRIARDIHDQLGQQMTALRMNLESLRVRCEGQPALGEQTARAQQLAEELDQSVDFLTWQLRPASLDHLGLSAALAELVSGWSERFGIPAEYDAPGAEALRLAAEAEANLYRLAQEALHNIFKHARATRVSVFLERRDDRAVLVIEDNGQGFDPAAVRHNGAEAGLGLVSMRERATLIGGEIEIESSSGRGTTIFVRVPVENSADRGSRVK